MRSKYKAILFDVDGVLIIPPKLFSQQYCEKYKVDSKKQEQFYATKEFRDSSIGKFDLKEAIRIHNDKWQWQGDTDDLIQMWFKAENYPNKSLLYIMKQLRARGTKLYLATQQEKYRKKYLEKEIFKDKIDGIFCSCDIGYAKHDDNFWKIVLKKVEFKPEQIAYFDDNQKLVRLAKKHGIAAFVYRSTDQVKSEILSS
jgi:putative hydrolase of the HAD superfamily